MALYLNASEPDVFSLCIWKIEEPLSFFESTFSLNHQLVRESSILQHYSSRMALRELLQQDIPIQKDENGKPFLENNDVRISLTHTKSFAAAMISKQYEVGIDLETVHPKVLRVASKFLLEEEIESIPEEEKVEKLILYWSAKEALYKLHGQRQIEFKHHLCIDAFQLEKEGTLNACIRTSQFIRESVRIQYRFFEDHVLTYVTGR